LELKNRLKHYRLSQSEYEKISGLLGRAPQGVEWALFSSLWSEHCSYKSSKVHLKKLFNQSPRVVMSFGENAGVIDLGMDEKIAFKMESHNHPSYIEPYQGAATGVGGILRDIFTMGARPIALANYLCFGEASAPRMTAIVDGVVRGIGGYGNCVGVPTITGQTEFHKSYNRNVLVNALAVGLFQKGERILSSMAKGVGNWVVYVGAKTGKDGVHGASMASESFDEKSESKKPTIQKGDPFYEKLLIESCIEVMQKDLVVAIQDMGAAGLTSSTFEMAARGNVGMAIHLDRVPLRDSSLTPEEILLSESQERMLLVVEPKNFNEIKKTFEKWNLDAEKIGEVIAERVVRLYWHSDKICEIDPHLLTDHAPQYERPYKDWEYPNQQSDINWNSHKVSHSGLQAVLTSLAGSSRSWVYGQYDQRVGGQTARDCSDSVGIVRLPQSGRALGLVLGCRPNLMRLDAQVGGVDSVAYPSLELAAKGFMPLAVTDCLNFGNPENPEIMSEFVASVQGMSAQCQDLETPIISGNVSFYNETLNTNITSTPSTGIVGLRDGLAKIPKSHFTEKNEDIFLLQYKAVEHNGAWGELQNQNPQFSGELDTKKIAQLVQLTRHLSLMSAVTATRVVGKFGLPYALARMCTSSIGCQVSSIAGDFKETLYQIIFVVHNDGAHSFQTLFQSLNAGFELIRLGVTKPDFLRVENSFEIKTQEIFNAYNHRWENHFRGLS
jgi:phosphoribosylformylglycinamidine synthase II